MTNQPPTGSQQAEFPHPDYDYSQPLGPPPGYGKKRIWPWLLGLLVLLVAMLGACGAVVVGGVMYMTRGPINATNTFIAHIDNGRYEEAYDSLCDETKLALSLDDFTAHFSAADTITGYRFTSLPTVTNGMTMVSGTIELDDAPVATTLGLHQEDDTWKVCFYDELPITEP